MRYFIISTIILLLFFKQNFAQNQVNDSLITENLSEVVVTAQYVPQSIKKSIYKIRIINSDDIKALGATNLRDLLYHELNLEVFQESAFAGTGIEIQGVSQENIKILIDGVPIVGRLNGTIDLNQIVLDNIDHVEIVEGPTSVYYGTDAMGGVINLITKKSELEKYSSSFQTYLESISTFNLSGNAGFTKNENTVNFGLGRNYFDGYQVDENISRKTDWGSREQYFGNLTFQHRFNKGNFKYSAKYFTEELTNLGEITPQNNAIDYVSNTRRFENVLSINTQLSKVNFIEGIVSLSNYKRIKKTLLTDLSDNSQDLIEKQTDTTKNETIFVKGQFSHVNKNHNLNYSIGFDTNIETIKGARIKNETQKMNSYGLFGSINFILFENLKVQPGARYTYNNVYGSIVSPAINLKYQINENNQILASYAKGFRAPSLNQLFLDFAVGPFLILGNENLEAENSHNIILSSQHQIKINGQKLIIEPSIFYNDIDNLITLSPIVNFTREYINVDINKTRGGKIQLGYEPIQNIKIKAGFSVLSKYNAFTNDYNTEDYIVTNNLNASINYTFKRIATTFNLYYKHTGEEIGYFVDKSSEDLVKTELSPYNLLDFTAFRSFYKDRINITLGIKNILNETNLENIVSSTSEVINSQSFLYGTSYFVKALIKL